MTTRRLYLLAREQTIPTLLQFASNAIGVDQCQSHLFLRYSWRDSDCAKEIDFSKSFACLIDVVNNCSYLNLVNVFKNCQFDARASHDTGFITFKKGNDFTFTFASVLDEVKGQTQNILRISGKATMSIAANDNDLLGYLLSLGI